MAQPGREGTAKLKALNPDNPLMKSFMRNQSNAPLPPKFRDKILTRLYFKCKKVDIRIMIKEARFSRVKIPKNGRSVYIPHKLPRKHVQHRVPESFGDKATMSETSWAGLIPKVWISLSRKMATATETKIRFWKKINKHHLSISPAPYCSYKRIFPQAHHKW